MKSGSKYFKDKLVASVEPMLTADIELIEFVEDLEPVFQMENLPFTFKYCHSLIFSGKNFRLQLSTSQFETGGDYLWIKRDDVEQSTTSIKVINQRCQRINFEYSKDDLPFRMKIEFDNSCLIIYAAEIYEAESRGVRLELNDEMLLVFDNEIESAKFDSVANYA